MLMTPGATKDVQYAPKMFAHMLRPRGRATTWMLRCRITLPQSKRRCGHKRWMHCCEVVVWTRPSEALLISKKWKNGFGVSIGAFCVLSLKKQHTRIGMLASTGWKFCHLRNRAQASPEGKRFCLPCNRLTVRDSIYVFSREVSVDAAEQVMNGQGQRIEMAELIVQLKGNPHNCFNDDEKGVRIIFKCVDLGDPNVVETSVVWVLSMSNMLPVGRLPHNKVLRIIAQPRVQDGTIKQWQAIVWTDFAETDIDAWRSRKIWQALKPRDEKAKRVAEIAVATPKSKYHRTIEELQSPGNIVENHSVQ